LRLSDAGDRIVSHLPRLALPFAFSAIIMESPVWSTEFGLGPLIAAALHDSSEVRPEVAAMLKLDPPGRLYEEDPHTAAWTSIAPTRIVARRSRFEVDLNRPRDLAVYLGPEHAWGLDVWHERPSDELVARSLTAYDDFYAHLRWVLERLLAKHPRLVVFDLHSFNHRRSGRGGPVDDPQEKPEINLGTRSMDRDYWGDLVNQWLSDMRSYDYFGRRLDVRENVCFFGGHLPTWIHEQFPQRVCVLAIEVKKFFMDEWTGELDRPQHQAIGAALQMAATRLVKLL
jgi:N-formylglutamate deformylase